MLFDFSNITGRKRRPDVAYVSFDSWPADRAIPHQEGWPVVPDLAVEVVSPANSADEVMEKVEEYLRVGVRCVWVLFPRQQLVQAYSSQHDGTRFHRDDVLPGLPVLTGFELPLSKLFPAA